jgi:hypothetical protein
LVTFRSLNTSPNTTVVICDNYYLLMYSFTYIYISASSLRLWLLDPSKTWYMYTFRYGVHTGARDEAIIVRFNDRGIESSWSLGVGWTLLQEFTDRTPQLFLREVK